MAFSKFVFVGLILFLLTQTFFYSAKISKVSSDTNEILKLLLEIKEIKEVSTTIEQQDQEHHLIADTVKNIGDWSFQSCDTAVITSGGVSTMLINCFYKNKQ